MKNQLLFQFFIVLLLGAFLSSCQKEEREYIDETDGGEIIALNSPLMQYLLRTSQNPGTYDDIIDGNGCASVVLPVVVIANGQQVTINVPEDVAIIHDIFNQFPGDEDILEIRFPIQVHLFDYSRIPVNNQAELEALASSCGMDDIEIGCLDFVYPISFLTYDSNWEVTGRITVDNDREMYNYLQGLSYHDYICLDFPVSLVLEDGSQVQVNSNQEIETLLADCAANPNDDPIDILQFEENVTTGVWYVNYFFDDYDETDNFQGYEFTFFTDGTAQTIKSGYTTTGTWGIVDDSKFELYFGTYPPLDDLDEDWEILEANAEIIKLRDISGGDGSIDYLTFGRNPQTGGNNTELNLLIENVITGSWFVNLMEESGQDFTPDFVSYEFTFFSNGTAQAVSSSNTIAGFWTAQANNGTLDFIINFETDLDPNFIKLNDNWGVIEASQFTIELSDESSNGTNTDYLTFGREPYGGGGNVPDPQELIDIFVSGTWYVDTFLDDGEDETAIFYGYDFYFYSNQTIYAGNGTLYVNGTWLVTLVNQELNFEFDMDSPLNGADDDNYKVLQYAQHTVTLITRNSQGDIEDTLIFKKN